MDERNRYRLIGGIFMLALGAIFLPMLFDPAPTPQPAMDGQSIAEEAARLHQMSDIADMPMPQIPPSDIQERVAALGEVVDDAGFLVASGTRLGEPQLLPTAEDADVFAVQLGSFREEANARELRAKVRESGFEAFISAVRKNGSQPVEIRHRVAVGPILERDQADALRKQLADTFALEALVVGMQP